MKNIIITYTNGDKCKATLSDNWRKIIFDIISEGFKASMTFKDAMGVPTNIINLSHVRSIEILHDSPEDYIHEF